MKRNQPLLDIIGENVKRLRIQNEWDQDELAILVGLTFSYITKIENGKRDIKTSTLAAFADVFKVSIEYLCTKYIPPPDVQDN
ncbi:helix-turn-helix domain-containing protein [Chitinophaga sp. Hz27]|uniref:helix-turn-helix domain-containing protein n=1 Tax=Chitinophaga sp. Hz27 TaxID=3347169 RepID=UPI0035DB848B